MNVEQIKGRIVDRGLARKNRFQVSIPAIGDSNFYAKTATTADITIGTSPYRYTAPTSQHPNDLIHGDLQISFYVDKEYNVRKVFQRWIDEMVDLQAGNWGYRDDYARDIIVEALDVDGSVKMTTTYVSCFPKTIQAIEHSFDSSDEIQTLDTTFVYQYYTIS